MMARLFSAPQKNVPKCSVPQCLAFLLIVSCFLYGGTSNTVSAEGVEKEPLVKVSAFLEKDRLPAGGECEVYLILKIKEGWHINANPPKPDFLVPTQFKISSKQKVVLKNVRYPKPVELKMKGFDDPIMVYEGTIGIRGTLAIPKQTEGKSDSLKMTIHFQACDDKRCLTPADADVTGDIPIAPAGEAVKLINERYFKKPAKTN